VQNFRFHTSSSLIFQILTTTTTTCNDTHTQLSIHTVFNDTVAIGNSLYEEVTTEARQADYYNAQRNFYNAISNKDRFGGKKINNIAASSFFILPLTTTT
jgi:hypothetical protein